MTVSAMMAVASGAFSGSPRALRARAKLGGGEDQEAVTLGGGEAHTPIQHPQTQRLGSGLEQRLCEPFQGHACPLGNEPVAHSSISRRAWSRTDSRRWTVKHES